MSAKASASNSVILPDEWDHELVAERQQTWREHYNPRTNEHEWLFQQFVVNSVRVERAQREEARLTRYFAIRASNCWDIDRRAAAEELGATINRRPTAVVAKLKQNLHGCDWLIVRWKCLKAILENDSDWDDNQTNLAFDLLGNPKEFREPAFWQSRPRTLAIIAQEISALEKRQKDVLSNLNEEEKQAAIHGVLVQPPPALRQARRAEANYFRRMQSAATRLQKERNDSRPMTPPPPPKQEIIESTPYTPMTDDDYRRLEYDLFEQLRIRTKATPAPASQSPQISQSKPLQPTPNRHDRRALKSRSNSK